MSKYYYLDTIKLDTIKLVTIKLDTIKLKLKYMGKINKTIEQFYTKPKTHQELVKNIKELTDVSISVEHPKIIIKLGEIKKRHKFLLLKDKANGQLYFICLPVEKKENHRDILEFAEKSYGKDFQLLDGGYVHTEDNKLIVDGISDIWVTGDREIIENILRKRFPDIEIEVEAIESFDSD
ncbi:MAG: hypothetical protein KAS12_00290 [Candidatus Aenigmarchaeota archaeon]|nr:hypothetical protein [Candidatus Aenigmarchaeota archaeon]